MASTTLIKNADWVVGWDDEFLTHRYIQDADVAFSGNAITHVGKSFNEPFDNIVDGEGLCVIPGLINIHAHPFTETMNKGFVEDGTSGLLGEYRWFNDLLSYTPGEDDMAVCSEVGFSELLLSGVTTLVDISLPYPGWMEIAEKSGLRIHLAPMYTSTEGMWEAVSEHEMKYTWSADGGKAQFDEALKIVDRAISHRSGRLNGVIMPAQVDTCMPDLLSDSLSASKQRGIPLQIHAAQLVTEFQEIHRRYGVTPIKFLDNLGVLSPGTIISHAIFLDHHHYLNFWGSQDDIDIVASSGASVAHCPNNYVRTWAVVMENFGRYKSKGINIGIGTDTFPHNMLEEMRLALMLCRAVSGQVEGVYTSDIFNAATIGGAQALQRDDIGRLTPGAKADLVLLDLNHPSMKPMRDPLRSLIFQAADRAVRDVYVDGEKVVGNGQVLTMDYQDASMKLDDVKRRMEEALPGMDRDGRKSEEVSPLVFSVHSE